MNGDRSMFSYFSPKNRGYVFYDDSYKGRIILFGIIGKFYIITTRHVLLLEDLKRNLLCISQLCDKGDNVTFDLYGGKV